jgi:hypothetical protein
MKRWLKGWLYAVLALLVASAAMWLLSHYGADPQTASPLLREGTWMKIHGAAAIAALVLLGAALQGHVIGAWRARTNRTTGSLMLSGALLLAVTGYLLYYFVDEGSHPLVGTAHWAVGFALPLVFLFHRLRPGRNTAWGLEGSPGRHDPSHPSVRSEE